MRILAAEDDFASRKFLVKYLQRFGVCDIVVDGKEAVEAFAMALEDQEPYDLVCLNIQMPRKDGTQVLREIRSMEAAFGIFGEKAVKAIMMDVQSQEEGTRRALGMGCAAYFAKPLDTDKFQEELKKIGLT